MNCFTERFAFISEHPDRLEKLNSLRKFLISRPFMVILTVLAGVITVFRLEYFGLVFFTIITLLILLVDNELIATTLPFLLISTFMIKDFDSFSKYIKIAWAAPICAAIFVVHFFLYRKEFRSGSTLWAQIAVTVAVMLGGLFKISAKEYFALTSIYYLLGLGIGMIIVYIVGYSCFEDRDDLNVRRTFAYIMYLVCLFCCFMILAHYAMNIGKVLQTKSILEPQWRNNVSTMIMLTMPFAFYLSIKEPHCFIVSLLTMPCLVLTSSRSGLIFGACEFVLCCIFILYADKKHRTRNLAIFTVCGLALILLSGDILTFISKTLTRFETMNNEPRAKLIRRAVEDFKSNPVFGRGIGYMGNRDVHPSKKFAACWYHSSPFQIIGSFGIVGVIGFCSQFYVRNRIFWSNISFYTIATYISYIGILMMSLVNPGEFCPVPYELIVVLMFTMIEHKSPQNKDRTLWDTRKEK